jgi:hypothetical protein
LPCLIPRRWSASIALLVGAATCLGLGAADGGCVSQGASGDAGSDQTVAMPGPDEGGAEDGGADAAASITSTMRLANMSPDLGPVDFCWRVTGTGTFTGPVLGGSFDAGAPVPSDAAAPDVALDAPLDAEGAVPDGAAAADGGGEPEAGDDGGGEAGAEDATTGSADATIDAGADGGGAGDAAVSDGGGAILRVGFGQASEVQTLPAIGTLDIALVAPYQLSCAAPRFVGRVTLDPGKVATVVAMGLRAADAGGPSALRLQAFVDERPGASAQVRVVNAALGSRGEGPAPPLSVQAGDVVLAPEVDPGETAAESSPPGVDALGYAPAPVFMSTAPIVLSTLADAGDGAARTWTTPFFDLGIGSGTSHTAFVVSLEEGALGVVWCGDPLLDTNTGACALQPAR